MKYLTSGNRFLTLIILLSFIVSFSPTGVAPTQASQSYSVPSQEGTISPDVLARLGISHPDGADMTALSQEVAQQVAQSGLLASPESIESGGLPSNMSLSSAFSAAVITTLSGDSRFNEVDLMGDFDGKEDLTADHSTKVKDFGAMPAGWSLTRAAISEHTIANGFTENVFYYGDSFGNVYVAAGSPLTTTVLNLPTILNAFGTLMSDDQIVVTGLAVNPVADLSSFANVNGSFSYFTGKVGEILMVSYWDTGGGLRLLSNNQLVRSGVLAFPIADTVSPAYAPSGIQSQAGFPVTVGGSFGVAFSTFSNLAGIAIDDDGSAYFQQVDLINFQGGNIVKIASVDTSTSSTGFQDRSLATSGFLTLSSLSPYQGFYGISSGPTKQVNRYTNYSGTSWAFGNIASLATGPDNVLYAALARSYVETDAADVQKTEGFFANPDDLGPTPSMIISFADTSGGTDVCTIPPDGVSTAGVLPVADGIADAVKAGLEIQPGFNNYRIFALGNGPDVRSQASLIGATLTNTLQLEFQVDYSVFSGLTVDEENKVYVVSGGAPAGVGLDPSPKLGEVLVFPDARPFDRRADFVDLRGETLPTPPFGGVSSGNGLSDRYDHIFWQAPIDAMAMTPGGISGLARGFLLYLNRTRNNATVFTDLPNGATQADDDTIGPFFFDAFDAGHQVAGGDDYTYPFTGDDDDGAGNPVISGQFNGGFEFVCTGDGANCTAPLNAFYLNSDGNLTIASAVTNTVPDPASFLSGSTMIAPAWADLDPGSRGVYSNTFPVQAIGFAGINHFKVRWIDVPERNQEGCGSQNTFAVSLFDDGTGVDENANQPYNPANPIGLNSVPFDLMEGSTVPFYYVDPQTSLPLGAVPRREGSGYFRFDYGRMDLLGTAASPVLVGYSAGGLSTGITSSDLGEVARERESALPQDPAVLIGDPAAIFAIFDYGTAATISVSGGITTPVPAVPAFDLRAEGNDPALSTPAGQPDQNRARVDLVNQQTPVFTLSKWVVSSVVEVGVPFSYTLTVLNTDIPVSGVLVSETLPISTTLVSAEQGGVSTTTGVEWTGFDLPSFNFLDFTWTVIPGCDTAGKSILGDQTFITSDQSPTPQYASRTVYSQNLGPAPDFSYLARGIDPIMVDFTNLSLRATDYHWDFGDGDTSIAANPSHTYPPGTYHVTLTASNLCNTAVFSESVRVPATYIPFVGY